MVVDLLTAGIGLHREHGVRRKRDSSGCARGPGLREAVLQRAHIELGLGLGGVSREQHSRLRDDVGGARFLFDAELEDEGAEDDGDVRGQAYRRGKSSVLHLTNGA